jgi:hypothetical protein
LSTIKIIFCALYSIDVCHHKYAGVKKREIGMKMVKFEAFKRAIEVDKMFSLWEFLPSSGNKKILAHAHPIPILLGNFLLFFPVLY